MLPISWFVCSIVVNVVFIGRAIELESICCEDEKEETYVSDPSTIQKLTPVTNDEKLKYECVRPVERFHTKKNNRPMLISFNQQRKRWMNYHCTIAKVFEVVVVTSLSRFCTRGESKRRALAGLNCP